MQTRKPKNPLVFEFPEGKITIYSNCDTWYVSPANDFGHKNRTYLSNDWFYEKLKNNFLGICKFAALFEYECNFKRGRVAIIKYCKDFIELTGDCGMDTQIWGMEVFAQEATGCEELHWW